MKYDDSIRKKIPSCDKIGHARLLNLPEQIKELLKNTKDLKTKTELLEEIAKNI